ncbi:hypothetical protein [Lysobacter sp. TAF61]|uniref:hypothetical protein n=1 Tax=Lysobacter sp. TAF61 TaxID=3233072 RepID=UPI003F9BE2F4
MLEATHVTGVDHAALIATLVANQVARIVERRARLGGLAGDWGGHSLRSGCVTEAGRQVVPLGEVMAMTEHRCVATVLGYFQAGQPPGQSRHAIAGRR